MSAPPNTALPFVDQVLEKKLNFCSFDFSGTGLSQGQYVSLGFHEKHDIKSVLGELSSRFNIKHFYLWGRSMGAAAAIKFMSMHPPKKCARLRCEYKVDGLVLDSSFQSLTELTIQIAKEKTSIPELLIKAVLMMIESSIEHKAGFKISDMELLEDTKCIKCPVLLLTSKDDKLVISSHSEKIYEAITHKDREIMFIRGEHNSKR
jgi:alpha-beta hydrolase superfamily lysophospholipase